MIVAFGSRFGPNMVLNIPKMAAMSLQKAFKTIPTPPRLMLVFSTSRGSLQAPYQHTRMHMDMCMRTHTHVYIYIYICMYVCMHVCMYIFLYIYIYINIDIYRYIYKLYKYI